MDYFLCCGCSADEDGRVCRYVRNSPDAARSFELNPLTARAHFRLNVKKYYTHIVQVLALTLFRSREPLELFLMRLITSNEKEI